LVVPSFFSIKVSVAGRTAGEGEEQSTDFRTEQHSGDGRDQRDPGTKDETHDELRRSGRGEFGPVETDWLQIVLQQSTSVHD
jgi:hypothetical protein